MSPDRQHTEPVRAFLRLFPVVQKAKKGYDRDWAVTGKMVMIRRGKFKWTTVILRLWRFRCRRT